MASRDASRDKAGLIAGGYAIWVVRLRWLILAGAALALVVVPNSLPALGDAGGMQMFAGVSTAARVEQHVVKLFGVPLLSGIAVVQRNPDGIDLDVLRDTAGAAAHVNLSTIAHGIPAQGIAGALPVPNSTRHPTTILTYLWGGTDVSAGGLMAAAEDYSTRLGPHADVVGVTGVDAVQVEQGRLVEARLEWVEIASMLAVAVIMGVAFRSLIAPLITLATAVLAYLLTIHLVGEAGAVFGIAAPSQLRPVIIALTLGIVTDYSVFFLSGMRRRMMRGVGARDAVLSAITHSVPIVVVAGVIVTGGVASVTVAHLPLFRVFGPGLAAMVVVALVVSITVVPALLAILGRLALWPGHPDKAEVEDVASTRRGRFARWLTRRPNALLAATVAVAALGAAGWPLLGFDASVASPQSLPPHNSVRAAAQAAGDGFVPGMLAPTELLVEQPGITGDRAALTELQRRLADQPEVAAVLGPHQRPAELPATFAHSGLGLFLAPGGDAARYLVVLRHDPLGARAIDDLNRLEKAMPAILAHSGLQRAHAGFYGATALGAQFINTAAGDVVRVAIAAGLVNLVLLMIFLRALVAPLFLLTCSGLSVLAALGLTTLVFQDFLGHSGLVFYAPFAAAVLLVSLGSDYNVFTVGRIWDHARTRRLRDALAVAIPRSSRSITVAGMTLAVSFGFVALIPVAPFRELAFTVAVGVLLDTFVVRSILVPALIVLFGRTSGWPGGRLKSTARPAGSGSADPVSSRG